MFLPEQALSFFTFFWCLLQNAVCPASNTMPWLCRDLVVARCAMGSCCRGPFCNDYAPVVFAVDRIFKVSRLYFHTWRMQCKHDLMWPCCDPLSSISPQAKCMDLTKHVTKPADCTTRANIFFHPLFIHSHGIAFATPFASARFEAGLQCLGEVVQPGRWRRRRLDGALQSDAELMGGRAELNM